MSETRGTIGYIAREVFSRMYGRVSHKSDVYSYGMLVLEMIGARKRNSVSNNNSSSMYFPDWIYKGLEKGDCKRLLGDQITEDEDEDFSKKMVLVGLSCIQACPSDRPSMNRVVEMMEGSLSSLEAPPTYLLHISASPMPPSSCPEEENTISSEEIDERYSRCGHSFSCGYHMDLYYPFWTPERKECGHPDFKVNCSGDFAEFSISNVKFRILEMNFESHIIRLARTNYLNYLCSQNPENATINQEVLPFSIHTKLSTLYYDCPYPMVEVQPNDYIGRLNCMNEIGGRSYFVAAPSDSGDRATLGQLNASCERNVGIPVSQSALKTAEKNQSLEDVFNEGFELSFNSECARCVTSGGACGWSSTKFVCYCKDKPHEQVCYPRKKSNDFSCSVSLKIPPSLS
ncbi:unnamed protein product [Arabidopsis halleri]